MALREDGPVVVDSEAQAQHDRPPARTASGPAIVLAEDSSTTPTRLVCMERASRRLSRRVDAQPWCLFGACEAAQDDQPRGGRRA